MPLSWLGSKQALSFDFDLEEPSGGIIVLGMKS